MTSIKSKNVHKNVKASSSTKELVIKSIHGKSGVDDVFLKEIQQLCLDYEGYDVTVKKIVQDADDVARVQYCENNAIVINSYYNSQNDLSEILLSKAKRIPKTLIRYVLALLYCKHLRKISILRSNINVATLIELKCALSPSIITDICLDGSFVPEANYAILLDQNTTMRHLSLSRCCLNDNVCELIASKLHLGAPGENLRLLNLSSNRITDGGANSLAQALRTNRTLRYLNLAGNHITDTGAFSLLDVMTEFHLTGIEIEQKHHRYGTYLKTKLRMYLERLHIETRSFKNVSSVSNTIQSDALKRHNLNKSLIRHSTTASIKSAKKRQQKFKSVLIEREQALDDLRPFVDPFNKDSTLTKDDVTYCTGNFVLAYLNLAYNNLSYLSVKRVTAVKLYQQNVKKASDGIIKVILNGNLLPGYCMEYDIVGSMIVYSPHNKKKPVHRHESR